MMRKKEGKRGKLLTCLPNDIKVGERERKRGKIVWKKLKAALA